MKDGQHSFICPLPRNFAESIGYIIVLWGSFESRMDASIDAFSSSLLHTLPENWRRLPFKKRKEMFRDLSRAYLSMNRKFEQIPIFTKICGISADLQWRRNIVAHGVYRIAPSESRNASNLPRFIASGTHKNKQREIEINEQFLQKLRHDISHLTGELAVRLAELGGVVNSIDFVVDDKDFLQDAQAGSFRLLPIPNIHEGTYAIGPPIVPTDAESCDPDKEPETP